MNKYIFIKLIVFLMLGNNLIYGQATSSGPSSPNSPLSAGDYLGWASGSSPTVSDLTIKTVDAIPIDFYVNNQYFLSIIAGTARQGDLDVIQPTNGYEIGDWTASTPTNHLVLWHNGNISSIFVGVGSGNLNSHLNNTFLGYNTGNSCSNAGVNN